MLACSLGVHLRATPSWTSSTVLSEEESTASSRGSRHAPSRCRQLSREGPVRHAEAPDASSPPRCTPPGGGCVPHARADFAHYPLGTRPGLRHRPPAGPTRTGVLGFGTRCTAGWVLAANPPRLFAPGGRSWIFPNPGRIRSGATVGANVDPPSGQSRRQPRVLTFTPDRQRQLIVRNENSRRLDVGVHDLDRGDPRG